MNDSGTAIFSIGQNIHLQKKANHQVYRVQRSFLEETYLIDTKLVQLYRLSPADNKRKRSDEESDHHEKKPKLATNADNDGTVQDVGDS